MFPVSQELFLSLPPFLSPSFTLPAASFNNTWGAETGERVSETSRQNSGRKPQRGRERGTKKAETPRNTTVMYKCKMVWWKTVWRGRRGQLKGGRLGLFVFFSLPSHIILKSISICIDGLSSVEEVHCEWRREGKDVISLMDLAIHHINKQNSQLSSPYRVSTLYKI